MDHHLASMDYWYTYVVLGQHRLSLINNMYAALESELPRMLSIVSERTCNLQCAHCIFQREKQRHLYAGESERELAARTIVRQMGPRPLVVHEGRIFQPEHLQWLAGVRAERPDAQVGMIDNGSFLRHAQSIRSAGFKFDWLDISIDGPEEIHNRQRNSANSFRAAIQGIVSAPEFLTQGGRVSSLFTLTSMNYLHVLQTCRIIPTEVREWHITTLSPARPEIASLSVDAFAFRVAWAQMKKVAHQRPVFFRIYYTDDWLKLLRVVGRNKMRAALDRAKVDLAVMQIEIDGVIVMYYPQSICTNETFVLDVDCFYRAPYAIAYTLHELQCGISRFGEDVRRYTVGKVDGRSNLVALYNQGVLNWRLHFSRPALEKEISVFDRIRQ